LKKNIQAEATSAQPGPSNKPVKQPGLKFEAIGPQNKTIRSASRAAEAGPSWDRAFVGPTTLLPPYLIKILTFNTCVSSLEVRLEVIWTGFVLSKLGVRYPNVTLPPP